MARQKYVTKPEVVEAEQTTVDTNYTDPSGALVRVARGEFAVFSPGGAVESVPAAEFARRFEAYVEPEPEKPKGKKDDKPKKEDA